MNKRQEEWCRFMAHEWRGRNHPERFMAICSHCSCYGLPVARARYSWERLDSHCYSCGVDWEFSKRYANGPVIALWGSAWAAVAHMAGGTK